MTEDNLLVKSNLCRCCHADGDFLNLSEFRTVCDELEDYALMLLDCFNLCVTQVTGELSKITYAICETCILKLREAYHFKQQIQSCEEKFIDLINRKAITVSGDSKVEIKIEYNEDNPHDNDDNLADEPNYPQSDEELFNAFKELPTRSTRSGKKETNKPSPKKLPGPKRKVATKAKTKSKTQSKTTKASATGSKDKSDSDVKNGANSEKNGGDGANKGQTAWQLNPQDYRRELDKICCNLCERTFSTNRRLRSIKFHLQTVHYKINLHICTICNKSFKVYKQLIDHKIKQHQIDDRVPCNACNAKLLNPAYLKLHMKGVHKLGEVLKCSLCDYETYFGKLCLKTHMQAHNEKTYKCSFCTKSFKRVSDRKAHEMIHTGEKKKVCKECGEAFVQKASLNYHMTKHHPAVNY